MKTQLFFKQIAMMDDFIPGLIPDNGLSAELEADHEAIVLLVSSLPLRSCVLHCRFALRRPGYGGEVEACWEEI